MPGEILTKEFLKPRRITITELAAAAGLSRKHVGDIVHGRAGVTAETAVRFGRVFGTSPKLWLELQNAVDLYDAEKALPEGAVCSFEMSKVPPAHTASGDLEQGEGAPVEPMVRKRTPAEAAAHIRELRKGTLLPPGETIKDLISFGRA